MAEDTGIAKYLSTNKNPHEISFDYSHDVDFGIDVSEEGITSAPIKSDLKELKEDLLWTISNTITDELKKQHISVEAIHQHVGIEISSRVSEQLVNERPVSLNPMTGEVKTEGDTVAMENVEITITFAPELSVKLNLKAMETIAENLVNEQIPTVAKHFDFHENTLSFEKPASLSPTLSVKRSPM